MKRLRMVDGVKIKCIGTDAQEWTSNPLLRFAQSVDTSTGEILNNNLKAWYRGMLFHIVPSTIKGRKPHLHLSGSLATYYNNGNGNAFDFTVEMLTEVVHDLGGKFNIDPQKAQLTKMEFGVNIVPLRPFKKIVGGLICHGACLWSLNKENGKVNGKKAIRTENDFKIYDKAAQLNRPTPLMRIEYVAKYSRAVNALGINNLAHLSDPARIQSLAPVILRLWGDTVFFDGKTSTTILRMTEKQKRRFLYLLRPVHWDSLNRFQRIRAKRTFLDLKTRFSTSKTQETISNLIDEKMKKITAQNRNVFQNFSGENSNTKPQRFPCLDKCGKRCFNTKGNAKGKKADFEVKKEDGENRKCKTCKTPIGHKRNNALYCSKICNNVQAQKRRTKRNRKARKVEAPILRTLFQKLQSGEPRKTLFMDITYSEHRRYYTDTLSENEILVTGKWLVRVKRIAIRETNGYGKFIFTSTRARQLVRYFTKGNLELGAKEREKHL